MSADLLVIGICGASGMASVSAFILGMRLGRVISPPPPVVIPRRPAEPLSEFLSDVSWEVVRSLKKHGPHHSFHEAYAVLLEEVDELWDWVKRKDHERDLGAMVVECRQIAAVATRIATQVVPMYERRRAAANPTVRETVTEVVDKIAVAAADAACAAPLGGIHGKDEP